MASRQVSSAYPSPQLHNLQGTHTRVPLSEATGNNQLHAVASTVPYQESKDFDPRQDVPLYSVPPTLASQSGPLPRTSLGLRRQQTRKAHAQRFTARNASGRNPILESRQYQAYRSRQNREGNESEAKWPAFLEDAFLDALINIPQHMGRRKFSMRGKPYGRNELIREYLWLTYIQSLPYGQRPDESMRRTRKQVSSHIQVLKGFLRDHPAAHLLFPPKKTPSNGFEESFKNDPCLIALSQGRLPNRRYDFFETIEHIMRPVIYHINLEGRDQRVVHTYTKLSAQMTKINIETLPNWRRKFPHLEEHYRTGDLNCPVIHMDVALQLSKDRPVPGAHLNPITEISVPGMETSQWHAVTSLIRPPQLCTNSEEDPPIEQKVIPTQMPSISEEESRIRVKFPPVTWAYILYHLTNLKLSYEKNCEAATYGETLDHSIRPVAEYVEQISMYQDLLSSQEHGSPLTRRGILLWTFRMAKPGDEGRTSWRYVNVVPSRSACMSPAPRTYNHLASMNENVSSFMDNSTHIPQAMMIDNMTQGLATPPATSGLQSPFGGHTYGYPSQPYDMGAENISFMSNDSMEHGSSMLDHEAENLDSFLANSNLNMGNYDQNGAAWDLNHDTEAFDGGDQGWPAYDDMAEHTPHLWDANQNTQAWPDINDTKHEPWMDENHAAAMGQHWHADEEANLIPTEEHKGHQTEYEQTVNEANDDVNVNNELNDSDGDDWDNISHPKDESLSHPEAEWHDMSLHPPPENSEVPPNAHHDEWNDANSPKEQLISQPEGLNEWAEVSNAEIAHPENQESHTLNLSPLHGLQQAEEQHAIPEAHDYHEESHTGQEEHHSVPHDEHDAQAHLQALNSAAFASNAHSFASNNSVSFDSASHSFDTNTNTNTSFDATSGIFSPKKGGYPWMAHSPENDGFDYNRLAERLRHE